MFFLGGGGVERWRGWTRSYLCCVLLLLYIQHTHDTNHRHYTSKTHVEYDMYHKTHHRYKCSPCPPNPHNHTPIVVTSSTASHTASPSTHDPALRCVGIAVPNTVDTCGVGNRCAVVHHDLYSAHTPCVHPPLLEHTVAANVSNRIEGSRRWVSHTRAKGRGGGVWWWLEPNK